MANKWIAEERFTDRGSRYWACAQSKYPCKEFRGAEEDCRWLADMLNKKRPARKGYVEVPVAATESMKTAGRVAQSIMAGLGMDWKAQMAAVYTAMLKNARMGESK